MEPVIEILNNPEQLAESVAKEFLQIVRLAYNTHKKLNVVLSGGSTPKMLLERISKPRFSNQVGWDFVNLFWGDERCVPPDDPESNYGMTRETLIKKISIPERNVYRIKGERDPYIECKRYAEQIMHVVSNFRNNLPIFDWIFLGIGSDGHTASLFPGAETLKIKKELCTVAEHPVTGQKRITLTLPVLNNSARVTFLVTGNTKSSIVEKILKRVGDFEKYPAAMVKPNAGDIEWYLDRAAASKL